MVLCRFLLRYSVAVSFCLPFLPLFALDFKTIWRCLQGLTCPMFSQIMYGIFLLSYGIDDDIILQFFLFCTLLFDLRCTVRAF